ncbi:MAG: hypothetical protein MUF43_10755 [Flavobacterium sp.]|jgi:hypothetical protein|nr:hypothetical protein [Flavobacterium sp.]
MKQVIREFLESFREKDLQKYSQVVNQYFRRKCRWVLLFPILFTSCAVQNLHDTKYKPIAKEGNFTFYDHLDTIYYDGGAQFYTKSFLERVTKKENVNYEKPVQLQIKNQVLYLQFEDCSQKKYVLQFHGRRYRKRFVFYLNYETVSFPFLFVTKHMTKFTVQLPENNYLAIKENSANEGMVLLFGAGNSFTNSYLFKIISDE